MARRRRRTPHFFRYVKLHGKLKSSMGTRPIPDEILEVPGPPIDGGIEPVTHEVAQEVQAIKHRGLAAGIGAHEHMKSVERDVHAAQASKVQGLEAPYRGRQSTPRVPLRGRPPRDVPGA